MAKAPRPVSLYLCQSYHVDPLRGEQSLVGLFRNLRCPHFPYRTPAFTAFALLTGGEGEGRMVLQVIRVGTEAVVYTHTIWYACLSQGLISTYQRKVSNCVFPAPGRYLFKLVFEGEDIAEQVVDVLQR